MEATMIVSSWVETTYESYNDDLIQGGDHL